MKALLILIGLALTVSGVAAQEKEKQILFTNVHVFDGASEQRIENANVLVEGNLIKSVSTEKIDAPDAEVIDGGGRTLMPGLIDSHSHLNMTALGGVTAMEGMRWDEIGARAAASAREWLEDGFTTVRDMGGLASGLKKTIDAGMLIGPRIYPSASYVSQTSGHGDLVLGSQNQFPQQSNYYRLGVAQLADGPAEVRRAVRRNFAEGASQIKIMMGGGISSEKGPLFAPQFTDAEVKAAVEEAATRDTYVAVHIYQDQHIRRAIELGVKSIEHGQFISEETARLMKEKGVFIAPFIGGMSPEAFQHPAYSVPGSPQFIKGKEFQKDSKDFIEIIKKVQPKIVVAVDIVFLAGEDARRGRDFEKFAFARAFGNLQALRSMTSIPGELAQMTGKNNPYPNKLGIIEEGAYADILIVDGNPLEDMTVLGANEKYLDAPARPRGIPTVRMIMKDGKVYKNILGK
ncbi:MAG: amidohydrolase family protein [Rhizobiaceae bacterium]